MDSSYSEISLDCEPVISATDASIHPYNLRRGMEDGPINVRPDCLELKNNSGSQIDEDGQKLSSCQKAITYLQSDGLVMRDGNLVLFVAEDLENKIKSSSPVTKRGDISASESKNSTPCLYRHIFIPPLPDLSHDVLSEFEVEARKVATSVDSISENLAAILHSASALTVGCLDTYRDAVCKTCDAVDYNIKSMYQLMAKCEELAKSTGIIYQLAGRIREMKKILELLESTMDS